MGGALDGLRVLDLSWGISGPMAGMMGMIDLLAGTDLDDEQRELANIAHQSANNLLGVVNNILDFSKLEAGNVTPESIPFSVTHSIEVASISRTIARALSLNEDLAEAIALAHDLGHSPFGHSGEEMLAECMRGHGGWCSPGPTGLWPSVRECSR